MLLKMFCVFDSKIGAYMQPFFLRSKGEALRSFTEAVNDPKTSFFKHPGDYTLFEIGEYSEETGKCVSYAVLQSLGTAIEFLKTPENTSFSPNLSQ